MIFLLLLAGLAAAAATGALVVASRDGYRRVPTKTYSRWI